MTNDLKLKIYPAVIGILGVCLLASLLFNVEVQIDRGVPTTTEPSEPQSPPVLPSASPTPPTPLASPSEPATPPPLAIPTPTETQVAPAVDPNATGGLRVSNQTEFPLRVALLHQQSETTTEATPAEASDSKAFNQPVHWDFAPGEGKTKGLILSLPSNNLELQTGDVLVAFALDGSRRYWGPYVVGQTSSPVWNEATAEWQLILQP